MAAAAISATLLLAACGAGESSSEPAGNTLPAHHVHDAVGRVFQSWIELGVSSQPTAILLTPDGTIITGWVGRFPEDQVLELAAEYTAG